MASPSSPAARATQALCPTALYRAGRFTTDCVLLDAAGRVVGYETRPPPGLRVSRFTGMALMPGFVNSHSHVFQRLIRGVAEAPTPGSTSTFWTWRQAMYALVERLDPDLFELVAKATFREMRAAGYVRVKEFHYLHHGPRGTPYDDANELAWRLVAAAEDAGIALEIERCLYLNVTENAQARFADATLDVAMARLESLAAHAPCPVGVAPHSVRAVGEDGFRAAAAWAARSGAELHAHIAEQPREVEECVARTGRRPLAWLESLGVLSPRVVGVHLTHLDADEVRMVGAAGMTACLCPSTEANLGDGLPALVPMLEGGARLAIGSDSQAHIDPFLELRSLEYQERLRRGVRHVFEPSRLLEATIERAEVGDRPTFVLLDLNAPSIAGTPTEHLSSALVMAAGADVVVGTVRGGALQPSDRRPDWLRVARQRLAR